MPAPRKAARKGHEPQTITADHRESRTHFLGLASESRHTSKFGKEDVQLGAVVPPLPRPVSVPCPPDLAVMGTRQKGPAGPVSHSKDMANQRRRTQHRPCQAACARKSRRTHQRNLKQSPKLCVVEWKYGMHEVLAGARVGCIPSPSLVLAHQDSIQRNAHRITHNS